ncbi:hypothetical protein CUMW_215440 [Citrus unshiu]|uniref:Fungal lipase-type domain-containing protein n=1 Tax=Citrus unshiu TaxID=55188 RepID=A0A2H5QBX5_CITUN|nr:hypothetical protein CUMW_215440 [Citrus unshiu]
MQSLQISSTVPAKNASIFQAKRASFKRQPSRLNPTAVNASINTAATSTQTLKLTTSSSNEVTRLHLSNLEKILQKQQPLTQPSQLDLQQPVHKKGSTENKGMVLEGLKRFWPEMKAAEEMSPRHLNRLQRLLSISSAEYSPRNNLGSRWREYHGCKDWAGLLDPLDENLRREVVRYGEFVQAAYHSFHSNPAMSAEEAPQPRYVALSDRSYKVTKSLYATSSVGLPKWVDDVAPDLGWMTQRSSWIGYVAVCDDRREIQRMGRRDIVIALRGTATCLEWAENFRAQLADMPHDKQSKVESGFLSLYNTRGAQVPSLSESVLEEVRRLMELYKGETLSITVTGHSLGAALSLLVADDISTCAPSVPPVAVFSFGGPRVGNRGFANRVKANNVKVLRIVNNQDLITRVPGNFIGEDVANENIKKMLNVINNEESEWAYSHVGTELRVDTKMSPYLKPNADVACCHDLEAYLHLVDGFMASDCPFRANAKRSLVKLLNDQRSNVKKLYTSKANALTGLNLQREGLFPSSSCLPSPS